MEELKYFTLPLYREIGTITYLVSKVEQLSEGKVTAFLKHPLAKDILIPFEAENFEQLISVQTQTMGKSNIQMCIEYIVKQTRKIEEINFDIRRDAEALGILFAINKGLTNPEKDRLNKISGKLAKLHFNSDLGLAIRFIKENEALLNDYNRMWFDSHYHKRKNKLNKEPKFDVDQTAALFNIAGYALSQQDSEGGS